MKGISKLLVFGGTLLCLSTSFASTDPTTFLGPTLRGVYTAPLTPDTAFSVSAEGGIKSERIGGALGWELTDNQRLKVAAEYLWQDITYNFFTGNTDQWVNQGALAAYYQYDFMQNSYNPQFNFNGYLSHAPSKSLSTDTGTFTSSSGLLTNFTDMRRIAGSNAGGLSPGVSIQPWQGGKVGLDLNYDDVRYNTDYVSSQNAVGFGGTAEFSQKLTENVGLNLSAGVRKPFNDYQASIDWGTTNAYGRWVLALGGDYNVGKDTLPNTYDVGVTVNYFAEPAAPKPVYKDYKGYKDQPLAPVVNNTLLDWTTDPVIMPRVLAIADQKLTTSCGYGIPKFAGSIANQVSGGGVGATLTFNSPTQFTGGNLTYTMTASSTGGFTLPAPRATINSSTGAVTWTKGGAGWTTTMTITATNPCGATVSSNTFTAS